MNLTDQIIAAKKLIKEAVANASEIVLNGSDNAKITRVSSSSIRMFTMASKDLGDNWSPFFHDWKAQYEKISEMLERQQFGALRELLETGSMAQGHSRMTFAPEVVDRTRSIVGNLLTELSRDEPTPSALKKKWAKP